MASRPTAAQTRTLCVIAKAGGWAHVWNDPPIPLRETFAYARDGSDEITIRMSTLRALEHDGYLERVEWEGRHQRSRLTESGRRAALEAK